MKRNNLEMKMPRHQNSRAHKISTFLQVALFAIALIMSFSPRAAFANPNREGVNILSPKKEIDYNVNQVEAKIRLEGDIKRTTVKIVLNGRDITKLFRQEDEEWRSGLLTKHLRESHGLRAGRNTLVVQAVDRSGLDFLVTRPFYIKGGGLGATAALPSAVTVNSSYIDQSNPNSLDSYSIALNGQLYNFAAMCPAGMTANYGMNVLVVDRQTLQVINQKCFDTSSSTAAFKSFLAGLNNTQLVIASSFLQASNLQSGEAFDTTSIGGTLYTCISGVCNSPKIYSIIGVPGLKAGQAYETSQGPTIVQGYTDYPTLSGVLLQDQYENYSFVPNIFGAFVRFKVIPGDSSGNPASVQFADAPLTINPPALPANWAGGYWLLMMHRYDLFCCFSSTLYETYNSTTNQDSLAAALQSAPADELIILTSLPSTTNPAPTVPTANLKAAIDSLGGAGYGLESGGGKLGDAYTLVSTTDTRVPRNEAIVSSSKYTDQSGVVAGVLARDRSNLYKPMTYVQVATRADDDTSDNLQYDLYNILAQPSTPWPVPNSSGQAAAYAALSGQITAQFGCSTGSSCNDYRSYYTDQDTQSNFCSTEPSSFSPPANPDGYTIEDYTTVQTQLQTEKIYVCNVLDLFNDLTTLFTQQQSSIPLLLNNASTEVGHVNAPTESNVTVNTNRLVNLALNLSKILPVPGFAQGAGAAQAFFQFGTSYQHTVAVVPSEKLALTVAQLDDGSVSQYIQLQAATATAINSILLDWGKLSTVGSDIGNQVPGYVWPSDTTNITSAFTLSTRTEFYDDLLPLVYSVDGWYRLAGNDPKNLGYWELPPDSNLLSCKLRYTARPANSFLNHSNVNDPSKWDTFVITTTTYSGNADFPSQDLVSILLGTPAQDGTGGLGLVPDLLFSTNSAIPSRYAINTVGKGAYDPNNQNCGCVGPATSFTDACTPNF